MTERETAWQRFDEALIEYREDAIYDFEHALSMQPLRQCESETALRAAVRALASSPAGSMIARDDVLHIIDQTEGGGREMVKLLKLLRAAVVALPSSPAGGLVEAVSRLVKIVEAQPDYANDPTAQEFVAQASAALSHRAGEPGERRVKQSEPINGFHIRHAEVDGGFAHRDERKPVERCPTCEGVGYTWEDCGHHDCRCRQVDCTDPFHAEPSVPTRGGADTPVESVAHAGEHEDGNVSAATPGQSGEGSIPAPSQPWTRESLGDAIEEALTARPWKGDGTAHGYARIAADIALSRSLGAVDYEAGAAMELRWWCATGSGMIPSIGESDELYCARRARAIIDAALVRRP